MNPAGILSPVRSAPSPENAFAVTVQLKVPPTAVIIPVLPKLALPSLVKVIATPVPDPSVVPTFKSPR